MNFSRAHNQWRRNIFSWYLLLVKKNTKSEEKIAPLDILKVCNLSTFDTSDF